MRIYLFTFCILLFASCATTRRAERHFYKSLKSEVETSPVFSTAYTGFNLVDAATGRTLCAVNADRYFTPASTTKILTLATCLKVLGDSIPGLRITGALLGGDEIRGGTRWIQAYLVEGTGDPTFLHPKFQAWQNVFKYLKTNSVIFTSDPGKPPVTRLGPGWSWDDYSEGYSPERSIFPIYGNVATIRWGGDNWVVHPKFYQDSLLYQWTPTNKSYFQRAETENRFIKSESVPDEQLFAFEAHIPIFNAEQQKFHLLADTIGGAYDSVEAGNDTDYPDSFIFSTPVDTVYRRMMYESDNFVAEQLLLACAGVKYDTLQQEKIIPWVKDSLFGALPNPPRWVDGSGLSRYNLITPRYLTGVLQQLYREQPRERLLSLFPAGGISGTLTDWYRGPDGKPFVFAKSGSMSGVQCLSGYLLTKTGKVLIFSFMHNNFVGSGKPWKAEMQRFLLELYNNGPQ